MFPLVTAALDDPSAKVRYKALISDWQVGLAHPALVGVELMGRIIAFWKGGDEKLRAQAVCAVERIGRGDHRLAVPHMERLLSMRADISEKVRMNMIWACENIGTEHPELFKVKMEMFAALLTDDAGYVRMKAPETFRVLSKRKPDARASGEKINELQMMVMQMRRKKRTELGLSVFNELKRKRRIGQLQKRALHANPPKVKFVLVCGEMIHAAPVNTPYTECITDDVKSQIYLHGGIDMKSLILYFSASGNTKKVAATIADAVCAVGTQPDIVQITEGLEIDFDAYDLVFLGAPSIQWIPPEPVRKYLKAEMDRARHGVRPIGAPRKPGKFGVVFCTFSGVHTGLNEGLVAGKYLGQFFEHMGFWVLDEWYVPGRFRGWEEGSRLGKLGDISNRPNAEDLRGVAIRTAEVMQTLVAR